MPATLLEFARVNDAAAATTKKLQKQQILADYFRTLDDDDLRLAVRYSGGRIFPSTDERVLGVSGAIVSDVILRKFELDPREYHDLVVRSGEIGEALATVIRQRSNDVPAGEALSPLLLKEMAAAFERLAETGNQQRKREIVRELFDRAVTSREAAYLSKIIFADLRTGVREGIVQAAIAQAFECKLAEVQRCQLLVGDLDEVALLARQNALQTASFRLFHPLQFMLATPQETAEEAAATIDGRRFFAEDKLDGIRAQIHKAADGKIAIYTRTMDRTDDSFPDVVAAVRNLPGEFLLDGEIVPWRAGMVLPFAHLQRRLGRKVLSPKMLRENPAAFIAFDILYQDGRLLMDQPLRERRAALDQLLVPMPAANGGATAPSGTGTILRTRVTEVGSAEEIDRSFCTARDCRNEGLILKDPESTYAPGRRGKMWLKLKTHLPTIDCVVTAAEFGHGKRRGVLSDYTFAVWTAEPDQPDATLVNIGKAFSGVTDEEIAQLTTIFLGLSRGQYGRVHYVEPKIVLEIACDQIQPSDRHASGYALRFPRIKRIRWDKRPEDADRLARVVEIYNSTANFAKREVIEPVKEPTLFDQIN